MSKRGHVPVRMCIGCRSRRKKEEMIRLVRTPGGLVPVKGKAWIGRGFYLCADSECLKRARKRKLLGETPHGMEDELRGPKEAPIFRPEIPNKFR